MPGDAKRDINLLRFYDFHQPPFLTFVVMLNINKNQSLSCMMGNSFSEYDSDVCRVSPNNNELSCPFTGITAVTSPVIGYNDQRDRIRYSNWTAHSNHYSFLFSIFGQIDNGRFILDKMKENQC